MIMGLYETLFVPLETSSYNKWTNDDLKCKRNALKEIHEMNLISVRTHLFSLHAQPT